MSYVACAGSWATRATAGDDATSAFTSIAAAPSEPSAAAGAEAIALATASSVVARGFQPSCARLQRVPVGIGIGPTSFRSPTFGHHAASADSAGRACTC